jgi:hypothetical protein
MSEERSGGMEEVYGAVGGTAPCSIRARRSRGGAASPAVSTAAASRSNCSIAPFDVGAGAVLDGGRVDDVDVADDAGSEGAGDVEVTSAGGVVGRET